MPIVQHHGGRLRLRAHSRFRPHPEPGRRRANKYNAWRHYTVDCTGNLGEAGDTEQEGGCFLVCHGHGRGGF